MALLRRARLDTHSLPINQRQRPRPSRVKLAPDSPSTPAARLRLALELSDFCLTLRDARRRKR